MLVNLCVQWFFIFSFLCVHAAHHCQFVFASALVVSLATMWAESTSGWCLYGFFAANKFWRLLKFISFSISSANCLMTTCSSAFRYGRRHDATSSLSRRSETKHFPTQNRLLNGKIVFFILHFSYGIQWNSSFGYISIEEWKTTLTRTGNSKRHNLLRNEMAIWWQEMK